MAGADPRTGPGWVSSTPGLVSWSSQTQHTRRRKASAAFEPALAPQPSPGEPLPQLAGPALQLLTGG